MGKDKKEKRIKCTSIGGQALMEGVMMRGRRSMAMAVKDPDGNVLLETKRLKKPGWYAKVPILRGVVSFVGSMISGVTTLLKSAEVSSPEEETPSKGAMAVAVLLGVVLAVGLFILLPSFISSMVFENLLHVGILWSSVIEGALRLVIFVLYLFLVSKLKDIRRTFMYHGAEHRTINCFEKGMDMTVENVQKCSTRHNRCGTTFLFFVMIFAIIVFSITNWVLSLWGIDHILLKMAFRLALLPLVAGLSYELLKFLAALPDNWFVNIFRAPGLALQRLTTYPPDDEMAEVALKSFLAVLKMEEDASYPELMFGQYPLLEVKNELKTIMASIEDNEVDTDFILCHVLSLTKRSELITKKYLNLAQYKDAKKFATSRASRMPLAYVLGSAEFYGITLKVGEGVLVPRSETELVCEEALKYAGVEGRALDMCCGSGAIARVLAEIGKMNVVAADKSLEAIGYARENLANVAATVLESDMFSAIEGEFDLIVCNPPYITENDYLGLMPDVRDYEPYMALVGGADGLRFYREFSESAPKFLADGGVVVLEIGYNQGDSVKAILSTAFKNVEIKKDYNGNDRIVIANKK